MGDGGKSVETVEAQCWSNERKSSLKKYLREAAASRLFSPNSQSLKIYHEKPVSSSSESVRKRLKVDRMVELKSVVTSSVHKNKLKAVFEPKTSECGLKMRKDINKNLEKKVEPECSTSSSLHVGRFYHEKDGSEKKVHRKSNLIAKEVCKNVNLKQEVKSKEKKVKSKEIDEF